MFPELNKPNPFTIEYYSKLIRFILPLIRSFNHNLGVKLVKLEGDVGKE